MKALAIAFSFLIFGYFSWDLYHFMNEPDSELNLARIEIDRITAETIQIQKKLQETEDFVRSLDVIRNRIQTQTEQLDAAKSQMSDVFDVPGVVKAIVLEAKKIGLQVPVVMPRAIEVGQYFDEQAIELELRGVFFQFYVFLERLADMQRLLTVDNADFRADGKNGRFTTLTSKIVVKIYRYKSLISNAATKKGA